MILLKRIVGFWKMNRYYEKLIHIFEFNLYRSLVLIQQSSAKA